MTGSLIDVIRGLQQLFRISFHPWYLLLLLTIAPIVGDTAQVAAQVSPADCTVEPWDTFTHAFVCPGGSYGYSPDAGVKITVRNSTNDPVSGALVEIDFSDCSTLCIDPITNGLSGTTDQSGTVILKPRVGGCATCAVLVKANGILIRSYTEVVSGDVDGDGIKNITDYAWFQKHKTSHCADLNGNGVGLDFPDILLLDAKTDRGNSSPCDPVMPSCQNFDDNAFHGWTACVGGPNVAITLQPNGQNGAADIFIRTQDQGGASILCSGPQFLGDYSHCNYNLSFDMRIISDTNTNGSNPIPPYLIFSNGTITASFSFNQAFWITDDQGTNPGWHHFVVPIRPADKNGTLPWNGYGSWTVTPAGADNWLKLLSDVTEIQFRVDIGPAQAELIGYDNICVVKTCSITGTKWNDLNGNGIRDSGEPPLPGVTISLVNYIAQTETPTVTDADGHYLFEVQPGSYAVRELETLGWTQTAPQSGEYYLDIELCDAVDDLDFGNTSGPCSPTDPLVINTGWNQTDQAVLSTGEADNEWMVISDPDAGTSEPRPAFVVGTYTGWAEPQANSRWLSSYPTSANDRNGHYVFEYLFCLQSTMNASLALTLRADDTASVYLNDHAIGSTGLDSFRPSRPPVSIAYSGSDYFLAGNNSLRVDVHNTNQQAMGFDLIGTIHGDTPLYHFCCTDSAGGIFGLVWDDQGGDGMKDATDPVLPNWTVLLTNAANSITTTRTTDALGNFYFKNLVSSIYILDEVVKPTWGRTKPTGKYKIFLTPGQIATNMNFGNKRGGVTHGGGHDIPSSSVIFTLERPEPVRINIYDVAGRLRRKIATSLLQAGDNSIAWDGLDDHGQPVPQGIYFSRTTLEFTNKVTTQRLLLLR